MLTESLGLSDRLWLQSILQTNPFYQQKFTTIPTEDLASSWTLLPTTTKAEILADQLAHPPYGTNQTAPADRYRRMHQTSGTTTGQPLRWQDDAAGWNAHLDCWDAIFAGIGLTLSDRLMFPFSFGPFLGFWTAFEAAVRAGHAVWPAGGMSSLARLKYIFDHQITVLFATPTYALHLAELAS
ncbi:MAG: phenylacetate--CoA ligase family protein, partial [Gemmataceae bacterium]